MNLDLAFDVFGDPAPGVAPPGVAPGAAPVVIAHGLFGSRRNFQTVAKALAVSRRVFTVDLRNHGESPHAARMDYPAMAADLAHLIDAHCGAHAHVIGHSMGGKAAMALALTAPARVAGLIVADIAPLAYGGGGGRHTELIRAMRAADLSAPGRADIEQQLLGAAPDPVMRAFVMHNLARGGDGGFYWRPNLAVLESAMADLAGFPAPPAGAVYKGPALFIRGGKSGYVKDEAAGGIKQLFPAARIETIAQSGHWPHADAPEEFLALVKAFLAGV
ncbi:MAG: alpha/beta fold hydrolase [Rhodospirillales bacterium]